MNVMEQPRLAIAARGDQRDVPVVLDGCNEFCRFLLPVAEVFWAVVPQDNERVFLFHGVSVSQFRPVAKTLLRKFGNADIPVDDWIFLLGQGIW